MGNIETLYVLNHSHTDIGFTDHQELVFRQHAQFIDEAIELCERTANYPPEAQYRWTCEVTGTTERYLEAAGAAKVDRFMKWHQLGRLDVAAMQYNFTPLLGVEQMYRSLYPIRRLREQWGLNIDTAMQSDVNGIAWLFADLLQDMGVEFLSMAINPVRGGVPKPYPSAFWWEAPSGRKLLVWNGFHYLFGRSVLKLGDWRFAEAEVTEAVKKLEAREDYPFDFLFFQSTHPMRVDNGPPDVDIAKFVKQWNERGKAPRLQLVGHREFARILASAAAELPVVTGEWIDWWCDGVASTAYETGVARESSQLLGMAEVLNSWIGAHEWGSAPYTRAEANATYELLSLYDEHTWGAYASVAAPAAPWTKGQENHKAGYAFRSSALAHDMLAKTANQIGDVLGERSPDGRFNLGDLTPAEAYPLDEERAILVLNTLPWPRRVIVAEPEQRGGAAPAGVLDMFFPPGVPWGGDKPDVEQMTCEGEVPGWGFSFLRRRCNTGSDIRVGEHWAENGAYRIAVDPAGGGLVEWTDKASGMNLAGLHKGWRLGQFVYETVQSRKGRDALFAADFSAKDFGAWIQDTPLNYDGPSAARIQEAKVGAGRASIVVDIDAPGLSSGTCTYMLWQGSRRLDVEWTFDKIGVETPESVFVAFPFAVEGISFLGDFNGLPCQPDVEQLPGSVKDWYPVQGWVGLDGSEQSVVLVPVDAPLVHLGDVNTGKTVETLSGGHPVVMSWSMNNHWFVNFKARQEGIIRLRYSLTSTPGRLDVQEANRFAAEIKTPPVVLRDRKPGESASGTLVRVREGVEAVLSSKVAEDESGFVVRLLNSKLSEQRVTIDFARPIKSARAVMPDEREGAAVGTDGSVVTTVVPARCSNSILVRW